MNPIEQKTKKVYATVLLFILYSIWVHVESLKYKMIWLKSPKSSEFAIFFNKQSSKTLQCLFHHVLTTIPLTFKNREIKKRKNPVGFEPAIPGFWGYGTPVQRKLPKTSLTNEKWDHFRYTRQVLKQS